MTQMSAYLNIITDPAWNIENLLSVLAWTILCWRKDRRAGLLAASAGLFLIQGLASLLLSALVGGNGMYPLAIKLVKGLICYGFLIMFSDYHRQTRLLIHFALFNAMVSLTALSGQCSILTGGYLPGAPEGIVRCLVQAVIPLAALFLKRHNFDEFPSVPSGCLHLEGILTCCILVVSVAETVLLTTTVSVVVAFMSAYFSLTVTSIVMIRAVYTMCREQNSIMELQAEKHRFQAEKEIAHMAQTSLEDLRCIRHDLKNQYSYMEILLSEKRYDELNSYFRELQDHMPAQLNLIDCGNPNINTVLNMEFARLRSEKITIEHRLVVPPVLPFPKGELNSVITNLLDNAGDECRRLLQNGKPEAKVRIEIYPHQSYLYIRCMNSTDRTVLDRSGSGLLTTKRDKQVHGYGTKIVAKLAEKYNGCANYQLADGMFVAEVMMDMTMGSEKCENQDRPV